MKLAQHLFALCLLLPAHFLVFAQSHDPEGYYVTTKGDTVPGKFIAYPEYYNSPSKVAFQAYASSTVLSLTPDLCRSFSIAHSDSYVAYQGRRLINTINYQALSPNLPDSFETVSIFLRELFNDGHYQLCELKDKRRTNFFISGAGFPLEELSYKVYTMEGSIFEAAGFRQRLAVLFADRLSQKPSLQRSMEKLAYTEDGLIRFFLSVTDNKPKKVEDKYPAQFFVGLGTSVNMFKVEGDPQQLNTVVGSYGTQFSPLIEIGIRLPTQRNYGKLFFMIRFNAYQFKNSGQFTDYANDVTIDTFKSTVLSLPLSVGYKLIDNSDVSLSFSGGICALFFLNNSQDGVHYPGDLPFHLDNGRTIAANLFVEAEVVLRKKLGVYAGYYLPNSMGNYTGYTPNHSSIKAGLRYNLF